MVTRLSNLAKTSLGERMCSNILFTDIRFHQKTLLGRFQYNNFTT
jgi:hypothetical protein